MGTRLIIGAIFTSLGFITIAVCYLGSRNPKEPKWASDTIMGTFIIPFAIGSIVMGPMLLGEALFLHSDLLSSSDITVSLSILVAGIFVLFMMRIPKHIEAYEALRKAAERQKPEDARVSKDNTLRQGV